MRSLDHGRLRRSPHRPSLLRGAAMLACAGVALAAVLGGSRWVWNAGLLDGYVADARSGLVGASARLGFRLREVLLVGRQRVSRDAVLAASELDLGSPTLALDPESIRARLERNRWIKSARVTTRLPDTVFIEIEERRPLALWQRDGQLRMIDDEGAVIADRELHRYTHLPLVVTPSEPARAKPVLDMLAHEPDLERRVRALIEVGGRRWNIRFDNGIDVLLPETESAVAWSELAELDRRHALLARRISAIDLRIPGRIVVTGIEDPEARGGTAKEAR